MSSLKGICLKCGFYSANATNAMSSHNVGSQFGEHVVILEYVKRLQLPNTSVVLDLGASYSKVGSNSKALMALGWAFELYDGCPEPHETDVIQKWIDLDFVPEKQCDVLSIDLDGNDYWILQALLESGQRPALIVAEINPIWPRNVKAVMPYKQDHVWDNTTYYGMSLGACEDLGRRFGYTLCHLHAGINAFMIKNSFIEKDPRLVKRISYTVKHDHIRHDPSKVWTFLE